MLDSKERFLNKPTPVPPDTQVPMVVGNDSSKGDGDKGATDPASDSTNGSGPESSSNRESNPPNADTGSARRDLEESDFTRPQEELLFF